MKKREAGFSAVEAIIILLVLLILGFAGWFAWNKSHDGKKAEIKVNKTTTATKDEKKATPDPTADWVTYTNAPGKFEFKHPKAWVFAAHPELCSEGLVLFAPTSAALGVCASESFGEMGVHSSAGDHRNDYKLKEGYINVTEASVQADGVTGVKYSGVASGQEEQEGPGALPDGSIVVQYVFYANDKTYVATYYQLPTYPNALADFDTLVTKTLQFTE